MSKFICDNCNKEFSSKGNLKIHRETVCLRLETNVFTCLYCNNNSTRKSNLDKHLKICPKREEYFLKQQLETITKEKNDLLLKSQESETVYKNEIEQLKKDHENFRLGTKQMIQSLREDNILKDKKIEHLKGEIKVFKLRDQEYIKLSERTKQVNIVNNNVNNIGNIYVQNLEPITDELIKETGSKIGMMDLKDGAPGIIRKFQPVLKDKIVCTDTTRNSLMYNYNGQLKRDARGQMLTDKIVNSTKAQYNICKDEIAKYYINLNEKEVSQIEREINDEHFENYKEYVRAIKTDSEFSKKKISNKISKSIAKFSKSKTQFENKVGSCPVVEEITDRNEESTNSVSVKTEGKFNPVASRKQTLINGRIFELHLDAHGNIIRKIRIRSSGLPYLTDEETDPSSREQSDNEVESGCEELPQQSTDRYSYWTHALNSRSSSVDSNSDDIFMDNECYGL